MWPFKKSEHRSADYGAALAQAYADLAGGTVVSAEKTAAAEFAVGLIGRAFTVAEVTGVDLAPQTLEAIGRGLALRGNAVFDLRADPVGGLVLLQASGWDIHGGADPASWTYALELPGPSSQSTVTRSGPDVVHARINALPESPWAGRSPLTAAGYTGTLVSNLERRAGEEANARAGNLLPVPDLNDTSKTALTADLEGLKGGVAIVPNSGGNFARPQQSGAPNDWNIKRFGLDYPDGNIALRRQAGADVVAAFGVPASLYAGGEGASVREGWRQFGVASQAWGRIVGDELSRKLERPVGLDFRRLASIDIAARARALGIFVGNGMPLEQALEEAGLRDDTE